jgi:hypothetical protein
MAGPCPAAGGLLVAQCDQRVRAGG